MDGCGRLPSVGAVVKGPRPSLPWFVVDAAGREVEPVSRYLRDLALVDASALTGRSYGYDLLRWFRVVWAVDVGWEQATEAETTVMVGWLRTASNPQRRRSRLDSMPAGVVNPKPGKATLRDGYAPTTIAHALTVVHGFYAFHQHYGRGPVVNPVPDSRDRRARMAHRSPLEAPVPTRRARLRPKVRDRQPRAIPDRLWDELFAQMGCDRDRALLACYVSSGARASELLGVRLEDVDWSAGRLWVITKGTGQRDPVPASPQAFAYTAAFLDQAGLPKPGEPMWRTRRGESRPLTYWAMRRVLQRANAVLGTNYTLHDTRHTAATSTSAASCGPRRNTGTPRPRSGPSSRNTSTNGRSSWVPVDVPTGRRARTSTPASDVRCSRSTRRCWPGWTSCRTTWSPAASMRSPKAGRGRSKVSS